MDNKEYGKIALKAKKEKVLEAVFLVTKKLDLAEPKINFNGCPEEKENQLAHYHPDEHKICISEQQLRKQDLDEVWRTAIHEITHFFVHGHGKEFHKVENEISKMGWRPPQGSVFVSGEDVLERDQRIRDEQLKGHKARNVGITIDKTRCNYNLCRRRRLLSRCPHCKRYFCKEHITPIIPGEKDNSVIKELSHHPCPDYVDFVKKRKDAEIEAYGKALDSFSRKRDSQNGSFKGEYEIGQKDRDADPESKYRLLVDELEEARTNSDRISILNEIERLVRLYNLTPKRGEEARIKKEITENLFTEKEWAKIINKTYSEYGPTGFGDEYGPNRWNSKKEGIFGRILKALGFKQKDKV